MKIGIPVLDELLKENYVFSLTDLVNPAITHEKLFIIFLL